MNSTEKLSLILQHAEEYYEHGRHYEFTEGGFIQYELFDTLEGPGIYFANMFVSRQYRGGEALTRLIRLCQDLEALHKPVVGICRVDKTNPHLETLKRVYASVGFLEYKQDDDSLYFRWDKQ